MFGVGWTEILVILVVALLVLGPNKLPDIAKGLGKGLRDFRKAMSSLDEDPTEPPPRPAAWSTPTTPPAPATPPATPAIPSGETSAALPPGVPPPEAPTDSLPTERTDSRAPKT